MHTHTGKAMCGHSRKADICKPKGAGSGEIETANTFQKCKEITLCYVAQSVEFCYSSPGKLIQPYVQKSRKYLRMCVLMVDLSLMDD